MIERVLRSPDEMDHEKFDELKTAARSVIARLETVTGDGTTIHDAHMHIAKIHGRIRALERDGECIYRNIHTTKESGKSVRVAMASLSTLVVLGQRIEAGRKYASLHGA